MFCFKGKQARMSVDSKSRSSNSEAQVGQRRAPHGPPRGPWMAAQSNPCPTGAEPVENGDLK